MLHPPSTSSASPKSSGVHSYCEVQNPIFASPLQFADQDSWTITSNGVTPSLTHVFFPNLFMVFLMQGPSVQSSYTLSSLEGIQPILFQNPLGDVLATGNFASSVSLIRHRDVDAKESDSVQFFRRWARRGEPFSPAPSFIRSLPFHSSPLSFFSLLLIRSDPDLGLAFLFTLLTSDQKA